MTASPTPTLYSATTDPTTGARVAKPAWRQAAVRFADYETAEAVASPLADVMTSAENDGLITSWWFIRKAPSWRLRFRLATDAKERGATAAAVFARLDALRDTGAITSWTETIYEPETHAFGGLTGMNLAHRLFHHDSRHIVTHLATLTGLGDLRRELSIMLCAAMMRAAGQDWYEQGDIWARVATLRSQPSDANAPAGRLDSRMRRLLTTDTAPGTPLTSTDGPLATFTNWADEFTHTGRDLHHLAADGTLERGLRGVLAHHVIFHWNRLGLHYPTQALLAHTAKAVIFA